jgi:hypothetical protein
MLVRPYDRPIDVVLLPIHVAARISLSLQFGQDTRPQSAALPPIEARGDGLPRTIALGKITPGSPSLGDPEHAIDDASVVMIRAAASSRVAGRQQGCEPCPLVIGQFVTSHARYSTSFRERALVLQRHLVIGQLP